LIDPSALEPAFTLVDGFHRADWRFIADWIELNVEEGDRENAWDEAASMWVSQLRADLGGSYSVSQSSGAILLSDLPLTTARWLLDYTGRIRRMIREILGDTAWRGSRGKNVVLLFTDLDDYDEYILHHYPEGEQPASGGCCIDSGYTHVVLPWASELDAANVIIHELAHDALAHLPLPVWLNEGVAMTLERAIGAPRPSTGEGDQMAVHSATLDWRPPLMWDELAERHFSFWNQENIQEFWAGTAFHTPGEMNELAYSLAEVLIKLLLERGNPLVFRAFLEGARRDDAGQTAAMDGLGAELGEVAGTFLGSGIWHPNRRAIIDCWRKAGWEHSTDPSGS
jgi:hypothetical protein